MRSARNFPGSAAGGRFCRLTHVHGSSPRAGRWVIQGKKREEVADRPEGRWPRFLRVALGVLFPSRGMVPVTRWKGVGR